MKLYHSSTVKVENPDLDHSRDYLDFGKGFYLTSLREQAVLYAERFLLRGRPAEKFDGSLDKAMDVFYKSATAQMIQDGVADLHCRSDHYLADEIYREYSEDSE